MGFFDSVKNSFSDSETSAIWNIVTAISQVDEIIAASKEKPQLMYKHSHRCSVCFIAKGTLEQASEEIKKYADVHFLNVVKNREASNHVTSELKLRHESPQAILIDEGEVIWHASHSSINADAILGHLKQD